MTVRIGIVGAGAAGTCVLDTLAGSTAAITVFEPTGRFGPGRAYHPGSAVAPMNLPPGKLSLRPDDPAHFTRWLADFPGHAEFVPRELYGRYLAEIFAGALARGPVSLVQSQVTAVRRDDSEFELRTRGGARHRFDAVFLCTGTTSPVDVYGLDGTSGFVDDPYPLDGRLGRLRGPVAVLGTGLSAVDVVLELAARDYPWPLLLASRSGYLPAVRDTGIGPFEVDHEVCGEPSLSDAYRVLVREFARRGLEIRSLHTEFRLDEDPAARLRRQLAQADAHDPALPLFLAVAGAFLSHAHRFGSQARIDLLRDWHVHLNALCAPMPPASARTLLDLVDAGRLTITGGITGVVPQSTGFVVSTGTGRHRVDQVVNTVRPRTTATAAGLLGSLVQAGLAVPHPLGGIRVDASTSAALDGGGRPVRGLHVFGEPVAGELYIETSVLTAITHRVRQAARHVLGVPV